MASSVPLVHPHHVNNTRYVGKLPLDAISVHGPPERHMVLMSTFQQAQVKTPNNFQTEICSGSIRIVCAHKIPDHRLNGLCAILYYISSLG